MSFVPVEDWRLVEARYLLERAEFYRLAGGLYLQEAGKTKTRKDARRLIRKYRKHMRASEAFRRKAIVLKRNYSKTQPR